MNKLVCFVLLIITVENAQGQAFNRLLYMGQGPEIATNIHPTDSTGKYAIGGITWPDSTRSAFNGFSAFLDKSGYPGAYKSHSLKSIPHFRVYKMDYDPHVRKSYYFGANPFGPYRATMAIAGDTVEHEFRDTITSGLSVFTAGLAANGYIVGGGWYQPVVERAHPFLICFDSTGKELWRDALPLPPPTTNASINGIRKLTDTSFIAVGGGYFHKSTDIEASTAKPLVVAYTYSGRKLWETSTGHRKFMGAADVVVEEDGSLVLCGAAATAQVIHEFSFYLYSSCIAYKVDAEGKLVWETVLPGKESDINELRRIIRLDDGNYLAVGSAFGVSGDDTTDYKGVVVKMDRDGNILWYRRHCNPENLELSHFLQDAMEAEDGSLIAVGHAEALRFGTMEPMEQMWLIGMDKNGCIDPADCPNYALGIQEGPEVEEGKLNIYPNPSTGLVNISLPETFGSGSAQLSLYDMQGRAIEQTTIIATPGQPLQYSTAHLPNGLYMVRIGMGEKTAGGKLVVSN